MPAPMLKRSFSYPAAGESPGWVLDYALRWSARRRRGFSFSVKSTGLLVTVPAGTTLENVDRFLARQRNWVEEHIRGWSDRKLLSYADGSLLPYRGGCLVLRLGFAGRRPELRPAPDEGGQRELRLPVPRGASRDEVREEALKWLVDEAKRVIPMRFRAMEALSPLKASSLIISSTTSRRGSCTSRGVIRLTWHLIMHQNAAIDYVAAHELAHLQEMNHSARFWAKVKEIMPNYEQARAILANRNKPIY